VEVEVEEWEGREEGVGATTSKVEGVGGRAAAPSVRLRGRGGMVDAAVA